MRVETKLGRDVAMDIDRQRMIVAPILRIVLSLTSLVDTSEFFEVSYSESFLLFTFSFLHPLNLSKMLLCSFKRKNACFHSIFFIVEFTTHTPPTPLLLFMFEWVAGR